MSDGVYPLKRRDESRKEEGGQEKAALFTFWPGRWHAITNLFATLSGKDGYFSTVRRRDDAVVSSVPGMPTWAKSPRNDLHRHAFEIDFGRGAKSRSGEG